MLESRRIRLAVLGARGIPARYGGFETFAEKLSERLVEKGIDVTVYCERNLTVDFPAKWNGVKLRYMPTLFSGGIGQIIYDVFSLCDAANRFDVIYVLGYTAPFAFFIPRLCGAKIWVNMDGIEHARAKWSWVARSYLRAMEWIASHCSDLVIADAMEIRRYLQEKYPRMRSCEVVEYGAQVVWQPPSLAHLEKWNLRSGGYYLVVCRIEPENHVLEIARGFLATDSDAQLIVVGSIDDASRYGAQCLGLGGERVRFVGSVYDQPTLLSLRLGCRGYFHGHSVGGTNPSLLEALGCGNLVLAHDNAFNREVAGDCAWYFKGVSDLPKIVFEVDKLTQEEIERREITARQRVSTRYSWERISQEYARLLRM